MDLEKKNYKNKVLGVCFYICMFLCVSVHPHIYMKNSKEFFNLIGYCTTTLNTMHGL